MKELTKEQLHTIMPYDKLAISINKKYYGRLFNTNINNLLYDCLIDELNDIYGDKEISKRIIKSLNLYYYPTSKGWKVGIYPVSILNNILKICGINKGTTVFYDLENTDDYNVIKDRFIKSLDYFIKETSDSNVSNILEKTKNNIDKLLNIDMSLLDKKVEDAMIPKNILFFLAYQSLLKLVETKNKKYAVLPYIYYNSFSKSQLFFWPRRVNSPSGMVWINDFNKLYEELLLDHPELLFSDKEMINSGNLIIGSGNGAVDVYNASDYTSRIDKKKISKYNIKDYQILGRKLKLYQDDRIKYVISGALILNGYIGFVCDNDMIVFDRLYEDDNYSIPATECAIYAMPADVIELMGKKKSDLISLIKEKSVPNLKRIYHSKNFEEKVLEIMGKESCSSKSFEEVLEEKKLVLKIHK